MGYMGCLPNGQFDLMCTIWENNGVLLESEIIFTNTSNLFLKSFKATITKFQINTLVRKGYLQRELKNGKKILKALKDKDTYFSFINAYLDTSFNQRMISLISKDHYSSDEALEFIKTFDRDSSSSISTYQNLPDEGQNKPKKCVPANNNNIFFEKEGKK